VCGREAEVRFPSFKTNGRGGVANSAVRPGEGRPSRERLGPSHEEKRKEDDT